jgi:hypothetical protein
MKTFDKEIEEKIKRVSEGADPDEEMDGPTVLLVSFKKDVEELLKTLKDNGLRPRYKYSNTSARTPFYFNSINPAGDLKRAFELAQDLGIKCELV